MSQAAAGGGQDETRERLLQAAREVFLEDGFDGARVQEIARRAGYTTGAIYASFSGKTGLMAETLGREGRAFLDAVLYAVESGAEGTLVLEELGVEVLTGRTSVTHRLLVETIAVATRDEEVHQELVPHLAYLEEAMAAALESASTEAIDPRLSAQAVAHLSLTLALGSFATKALGLAQPTPEEARLLMRKVVEALGAPSDRPEAGEQ